MEDVRPATYEDLFHLPETVVGEIIGGELHAHPRPRPRHADTSSAINVFIRGPFHHGRGGPGGWRIIVEPELHLEADILVPDLAGWRRETLPALPETAWFETVPDWVCEVLSPATVRHDRLRKLPRYAAHGVAWCWLVDPDSQTIEVFRLSGGEWVLAANAVGTEGEAALPPFDAVPLPLADLWGA